MQSSISADFLLYRRLLNYVIPHWRVFFLAILSMAVLALTAPAIPALMQPMLDGAFVNKDPKTIALMPYLFVGLFFIRGLASYIGNSSLHWVGTKTIMSLRQEMFDRLIDCPMRYFDDQQSGHIVSRFAFDVIQIKEAATNAVSTLVKDTLTVVGLLGWMFFIDWALALICMLGAPLVAVVISIIRKRLRRMSHRLQSTMGDIQHVLNEALYAQKIIKLYGGKQSESLRFNHTVNKNRQFHNKLGFIATVSSPGVQFITSIFLAIVVYMATKQASDDSITVGDFVSFFTAMAMLLDPLKRLAGVNEHLQKGLAACDNVFNLIDSDIEIDNGSQQLLNPYGKIEFRQLHFRYDNAQQDALVDINLTVEPGETIALVGESGSGKSTLASLLPRFYEPVSGEIYIDDINIQELSLMSLRKNIAFVSQEVILFNDTIRNNIAYGDLQNAKDMSIWKAAESAYASDFINQLPAKMNTVTGEGGTRLSGGQRQRLAIARALLKDARLLIMDEATSSLDTQSERHIQSALENVRKERTCVIIAHRLSTIENADRIIVLDKGRIVEQGRHEDLLNQNNVYARLYKNQFMGS